jgi:hypothetical protein
MSDVFVEQTQYCTRAEIHDQYDWTDSMIRRYLGEPDLVEQRRSPVHGHYTVHRWLRKRILNAQSAPRFRARRPEPEPAEVPLLDAVREASRSAHRWRDRASARWEAGEGKSASMASAYKKYWYRLKDTGIIAMHRAGELRYLGASPGDGGV